MTPVKNTTLKSILALSFVFIGSCSSFHTPISRETFSASPSSPALHGAAAPRHIDHIENGFQWPVNSARLTRGFLPNKKRPHLGLDLAAPKGTPIFGSHGGTVIYAGKEFRGYGKMVLIESGHGWATLYAHFNKILVSEGQRIRPGEIIGEMGRTGRATGVHLHFEIRKDRSPIDPLPMLPKVVASNRK